MTRARERWEKLRELFEAAREHSPEQRESFLQEACGDSALRDQLRCLLEAHQALEDGLERSFLEALDCDRAAALLAASGDMHGLMGPDELELRGTLGRYRITRRLGQGGMGVVYLAHDPRLDRHVAIKLLPRALSLDDSARHRLENEARAASALDHPSIVTVHEIGETEDGALFIVMGYYEGKTLQDWLKEGPPSVREAWSLTARIADGLVAAHAQGIVHRDVKPANILVMPNGEARIVDFGLARAAGSDLTRTGATFGTIAYMSPEQTHGEPAAPATDVWSLGVTLYEMFTGRLPFPAENGQALVYAIRNDDPPPVRSLRPQVPASVAEIIERCLRKNPKERFGNAGELLKAMSLPGSPPLPERGRFGWQRPRLRYVAGTGLLGALLFGGFMYGLSLQAPNGSTAEPDESAVPASNRLAVLPLANLGSDPADAYFAEGMTEELISRLSKLAGLDVIARTSVMRYRDDPPGVAEIGQALDVSTVLEGSIRRDRDRVRITMQLINVASEDHLWSRDFDAELTDMLAVQRRIAERVAEALQLTIGTPGRDTVTKRGTSSAAYLEYLKGRYYLGKLNRASFIKARDHFQQALDLDPIFAQAWSGLADAYNHMTSVHAMRAHEASPRARAAGERALALDPDSAEAHAALALVLDMHYWESAQAEEHFRRAIELDPGYAMARRNYATHLRNLGRFEEALAQARKAQRLDPLSIFPRLEEGIILFVSRRYDDTIKHCNELLNADPRSPLVYLLLAKAYAEKQSYEEALTTLKIGDPDESKPGFQATRGYIYGLMGRQSDARQVLNTLEAKSEEMRATSFHKSVIPIALGEHAKALDLLEQAAEERTWLIRLLKVEPTFDPLRPEPRFQALVERVKLAGAD